MLTVGFERRLLLQRISFTIGAFSMIVRFSVGPGRGSDYENMSPQMKDQFGSLSEYPSWHDNLRAGDTLLSTPSIPLSRTVFLTKLTT